MNSARDNFAVRKRLFDLLRTDGQFNEFCLDYFPHVHRQFSSQMDRLSQTNLLLTMVGAGQLSQALDRAFKSYGESEEKSADPSLKDRAFGRGDPYLHCDRGAQFSYVQGMLSNARANEHEVILLPGGQDEAHKFFLARIEGALESHPARRISWVNWPRRYSPGARGMPTTENELLSALQQSIGKDSATDLKQILAKELDCHHLIFLQPVVDRRIDEDTLLKYYLKLLPSFLVKADLERLKFRCKFIQPIAWHPQPLWRRVLRINHALSCRQATKLIHKLETANCPPLVIGKTKPLTPITKDDVDNFLAVIGYANDLAAAERKIERDGFTREVLRNTASSEQILRRIADLLPDDVEQRQ